MPGGYQAKPASKGGALKAVGDTALGAGMMEGGRKVVERMAGIKPPQFIKQPWQSPWRRRTSHRACSC